MTIPPSFMVRLAAVALLGVTSGCAGAPTGTDLSRAFEPPRSWEAAVYFSFADSAWVPGADYSTRIEFHDGAQQRVVTASDLFDASTGETRTPWYRVWPGKDGQVTAVHVTLRHSSGAVTSAEYPLPIQRDEFMTIYARVYKRDPNEWYISMPKHRRAFPVNPGARAAPGDSLWIEHAGRNRGCFQCVN